MEYIDIIIAAVSGGTLAQVFTYLIKRQEVKTDDFETIVAQWKEDNKRLREENDEHERRQNELYRRISELEQKISQLNTKLLIMESSYMHIPLPSWLKDIDGTMLALNDSYEKEFLLPSGLNRTDYIGKTDYAVWSEEIARKFIDNDRKVLVSDKKTWFGKEEIIINGIDVSKNWKVLKYVRYAGNVAVGIAGIAIPTK